MRFQSCSQAFQILRVNAYDSAIRAVDIGYEEKRNCQRYGQDQEESTTPSMRDVAH